MNVQCHSQQQRWTRAEWGPYVRYRFTPPPHPIPSHPIPSLDIDKDYSLHIEAAQFIFSVLPWPVPSNTNCLQVHLVVHSFDQLPYSLVYCRIMKVVPRPPKHPLGPRLLPRLPCG